ncbi:MAG: hypothetical protein IMF07_02015 [Proteobacteria bacterium]|nr:hypothetical protein [Pseudomonadota bacterium]
MERLKKLLAEKKMHLEFTKAAKEKLIFTKK